MNAKVPVSFISTPLDPRQKNSGMTPPPEIEINVIPVIFKRKSRGGVVV